MHLATEVRMSHWRQHARAMFSHVLRIRSGACLYGP